MCSQDVFVNFKAKYFGKLLVDVSKALMLDGWTDSEEQLRKIAQIKLVLLSLLMCTLAALTVFPVLTVEIGAFLPCFRVITRSAANKWQLGARYYFK